MNPRLRTIAACNEQARANIIEGAFASKLPPRNVEAEAQALWRAAVTLATAEPRQPGSYTPLTLPTTRKV